MCLAYCPLADFLEGEIEKKRSQSRKILDVAFSVLWPAA